MKATLIAMMVITSTLVLAQKREMDPEGRAQKLTERMEKELALDNEQTEKVLDVNLQTLTRLAQVRTEVDRSECREAAKDILDQQDAQLLDILNQKQWQDYVEMKEAFKKERQGSRSGGL